MRGQKVRNLARIDPDQADSLRRPDHRPLIGPRHPRVIDDSTADRANPGQLERTARPRLGQARTHNQRDLLASRCGGRDRHLQPGAPRWKQRRMPREWIRFSTHEHSFRDPGGAQLDFQLRRQHIVGRPVEPAFQTTGRSRNEELAPDEARRLDRELAKDELANRPRRHRLEDETVVSPALLLQLGRKVGCRLSRCIPPRRGASQGSPWSHRLSRSH